MVFSMARPILLHSYLLVCLFCLVSSAAATLALPPFLLRQSALERVQCQRVLNREVVFCSRGREIDVRGDKNMEEHDAKYPNNPQVYTITKARPKSAWEGRPAHGRFLDARTDFALFFLEPLCSKTVVLGSVLEFLKIEQGAETRDVPLLGRCAPLKLCFSSPPPQKKQGRKLILIWKKRVCWMP